MCYPYPGPRCSYHARKAYIEAQQKYELTTNVNQKIVLGKQLEEKKCLYESTNHGQNALKREINVSNGLQKVELLVRLKNGESLKNKQMKALADVLEHKDTFLKETFVEHNVKLGRYKNACAIAMLELSKLFPKIEFHMTHKDTIVSDLGKLFVIPEKYQSEWDTVKQVGTSFTHTNQSLTSVLNNSFSLTNLNKTDEEKVWKWVQTVLKKEDYTGFVAVNSKTQSVVMASLDKLPGMYKVGLKIHKKLGGTSPFMGDMEGIKPLLEGTSFKKGKLVKINKMSKTVLYGVPPQPKQDCKISEEIYLG